MKRVMISELKAHLSAYLDAVRHGETVEVCDRRTPIARLSPIMEWGDDFYVLSAKRPVSNLKKVHGVPPREKVDVVALLRESRDQR